MAECPQWTVLPMQNPENFAVSFLKSLKYYIQILFFFFFLFKVSLHQHLAPLWLWQKPLWTFHQPLNTSQNHFLTSTSLNKSWLLIRQTCKRRCAHTLRFVSWVPSSFQQGLFHVSNCATFQPSTPSPHTPSAPPTYRKLHSSSSQRN